MSVQRRFELILRLAWLCGLGVLPVGHAAEKASAGNGPDIRFKTARAGLVSLNIYAPDGSLVRRLLTNERMAAGKHTVSWDGKMPGRAEPVAPGQYTWRGLFSEGIGLKLRGWVGNVNLPPWETPGGLGGWGGGNAGVPSGVTADDQRVYLGWSYAIDGRPILACDPQGKPLWRSQHADGPFGCKALAVDDGLVYVLGNGVGDTAVTGGTVIRRLKAQDGSLAPWPDGKTDLAITSLWPADGKDKPFAADAMAVRHGRIYLSFTNDEFLSVVDAKTGKYVQTIVGAPPGMIDVAPTQTESPDTPGKLIDADFALISLGGGVLGRVLIIHDPFWVPMSDMSPSDRDERITALTIIGDHAKYHHHTAYVGFGAPTHQVEARPLLDPENTTWVAGRAGGRSLVGPWQPDALRSIRGVALAPDGRLWVAEGDPYPKRFSVWDTDGKEGKLVREFFGPPDWSGAGGAINPLDPDLMVAQNCEWRIDRKTGEAACLGVISRDPIYCARFGIGANGHAYLVTSSNPLGFMPIRIYERVGDGDYKLRTKIYWASDDGRELPAGDPPEHVTKTIIWSDKNGDGEEQPDERQIFPRLINCLASEAMQDLTLKQLKVSGWTECGAPQFALDASMNLPADALLSPDRRFFVRMPIVGKDWSTVCTEVSTGQKLWEWEKPEEKPCDGLSYGIAHLPPPLNNIWVLGAIDGFWHMVNQDGFEVGKFFVNDPHDLCWPKAAVPGADMTKAAPMRSGGSVTQGADGKLYIQAGDSAFWNMEVTGLDKVKALPGGTITVPAAK